MSVKSLVPKNQYRYYYECMTPDKKRVYTKLLDGLLSFQKTIRCSGCSVKEVEEVYHSLRYDVPELFFVKTVTFRYYPHIKNECDVIVQYRFDKGVTENTLIAMEQKFAGFIQSTKSLSDIQKEKAIHDAIASIVTYKDVDAPYSHEAPGTLLYHIGVCEGIAKAFKYLADRVNLKAIVAVGTSDAQGNSGGHAWNIVMVDNSFYQLDVTFDATIAKGEARYDYFNLSDDEMAIDHQWTVTLPQCTKSMSYYKLQGVYFEKKSQLEAFFKNLPHSRKKVIFQLPPFTKRKEEVVDMVSQIARENLCRGLFGRAFTLSYNLERMVFQLDIV